MRAPLQQNIDALARAVRQDMLRELNNAAQSPMISDKLKYLASATTSAKLLHRMGK